MSHADLVFTGGAVFTADTVRSRARSVAVIGERIVAVGAGDVDELIGPRTEVVDLRGRLLVPGFQDAHVHPVWGGLDMLRCDLAEYATADEYLSAIGRYAREHPDEWILGGGWQMSAFPGGTPTAATLDAVVPDRPAFFPNRDGHGAWVNSAALRLAGIDEGTPDPADGRIERDAAGRPTGTLHEGAMSLVNRLLPEESLERLTEALLVGQRYLHSYGITAWQDAIVGSYGDAGDPYAAYLAADAAGILTARVVGALWWDRTKGVEQIPSLVERRAGSLSPRAPNGRSLSSPKGRPWSKRRLGNLSDRAIPGLLTLPPEAALLPEPAERSRRFAATSVKIMQDGVAENFTAAMLEPYGDGHGHPTGNSGISFVPPEVLDDAVARLDAEGFQVHFHAIGDRAVRECLDAVEHAIARNSRSDNRHHVAHIQVVHPEDIPRFRELGVAANMQSLWATLEPQMVELTLPFLGSPQDAWQYPFGDLLRAGTVLAAGSDWSVSTPNPLAAIHTAVNRTAAPGYEEGEYDPFLPEQAIDLATSLTAYTAGSAWVNHLDEATGTIELGKFADLAVLDRDPFAGPADEIGATRVLQTFVGGERVYAAPDA